MPAIFRFVVTFQLPPVLSWQGLKSIVSQRFDHTSVGAFHRLCGDDPVDGGFFGRQPPRIRQHLAPRTFAPRTFALRTSHSALRTPHSALRTPHSALNYPFLRRSASLFLGLEIVLLRSQTIRPVS